MVAGVSLVFGGCDPSASLAARNDSPTPFLFRYRADPEPSEPGYEPSTFVWKLPPNSGGVAIPRGIGALPAAIELLDEDCQVIEHWRSEHGGLVVISAAGQPSFDREARSLPDIGSTLTLTSNCQ